MASKEEIAHAWAQLEKIDPDYEKNYNLADASLIDGISLEKLTDPVMLADGFYYNKQSAIAFINTNTLGSPHTRAPLKNRDFIESTYINLAIVDRIWALIQQVQAKQIPLKSCDENSLLPSSSSSEENASAKIWRKCFNLKAKLKGDIALLRNAETISNEFDQIEEKFNRRQNPSRENIETVFKLFSALHSFLTSIDSNHFALSQIKLLLEEIGKMDLSQPPLAHEQEQSKITPNADLSSSSSSSSSSGSFHSFQQSMFFSPASSSSSSHLNPIIITTPTDAIQRRYNTLYFLLTQLDVDLDPNRNHILYTEKYEQLLNRLTILRHDINRALLDYQRKYRNIHLEASRQYIPPQQENSLSLDVAFSKFLSTLEGEHLLPRNASQYAKYDDSFLSQRFNPNGIETTVTFGLFSEDTLVDTARLSARLNAAGIPYTLEISTFCYYMHGSHKIPATQVRFECTDPAIYSIAIHAYHIQSQFLDDVDIYRDHILNPYYKQMRQKELPIPQNRSPRHVMNIYFIGDEGSGKSSLLKQTIENQYDGIAPPLANISGIIIRPMPGVSRIELKIELKTLEEFISLEKKHSRFITVCVFDLTNRQSYERSLLAFQNLPQNAYRNSRCILVGTKCDLENRQISAEEAQEKSRELNCPYIEVSAEENTHIDYFILTLYVEGWELLQIKTPGQLWHDQPFIDIFRRAHRSIEPNSREQLPHGLLNRP